VDVRHSAGAEQGALLPADVAEWVAAALEKNPKHRPDSLTGLVLALGRLAAPQAELGKTVMTTIDVEPGAGNVLSVDLHE
jgi:hypothetical protein